VTAEAPWLPALPGRWAVVQMRRLVTFRNGADYKDVEVERGGFPVYGSGGEFRRASNYLYDGTSVLFGRKGTIDRPLLVSGKFWTVDTMFYTEIGDGTEPRFLHYYATTMPFSYYSTSTALPSMTQGELGGHRMPVPPLDEQRAIAGYLDRETARIDTLIEEQQHLIEMLRERREALIERSLLDSSDAPIRLSRIASSRSGDVPPPLEEDGQYVVWGAGRVVGYTSQANAQAGDLLIGRVGQGSVGKVRRLTEAAWATDNTIVLRLDSSVADPRYVEYGLRLIPRFELVGGGAMPLVTADRLLAQPVPFTTLAAQERIADYLDEQTAKIDVLITETERFIELSKERRAALITAAVTGQIDVREMA